MVFIPLTGPSEKGSKYFHVRVISYGGISIPLKLIINMSRAGLL